MFVAVVEEDFLSLKRAADVGLSAGWIASGLGAVAEYLISVLRQIEVIVIAEDTSALAFESPGIIQQYSMILISILEDGPDIGFFVLIADPQSQGPVIGIKIVPPIGGPSDPGHVRFPHFWILLFSVLNICSPLIVVVGIDIWCYECREDRQTDVVSCHCVGQHGGPCAGDIWVELEDIGGEGGLAGYIVLDEDGGCLVESLGGDDVSHAVRQHIDPAGIGFVQSREEVEQGVGGLPGALLAAVEMPDAENTIIERGPKEGTEASLVAELPHPLVRCFCEGAFLKWGHIPAVDKEHEVLFGISLGRRRVRAVGVLGGGFAWPYIPLDAWGFNLFGVPALVHLFDVFEFDPHASESSDLLLVFVESDLQFPLAFVIALEDEIGVRV